MDTAKKYHHYSTLSERMYEKVFPLFSTPQRMRFAELFRV